MRIVNFGVGLYAQNEVSDGAVLNLEFAPAIWDGLTGLVVRKSVRI